MAKTLTSKNISSLLNSGLTQGKELWEQVIPNKKLLKKYESLLQEKFEDLKKGEKLDAIIKPLRKQLEKSCLKPLEAKNMQEFSQRVVSVLRVQAKKQKKSLEKKMGIKKAPVRKGKPRTRSAKTSA